MKNVHVVSVSGLSKTVRIRSGPYENRIRPYLFVDPKFHVQNCQESLRIPRI